MRAPMHPSVLGRSIPWAISVNTNKHLLAHMRMCSIQGTVWMPFGAYRRPGLKAVARHCVQVQWPGTASRTAGSGTTVRARLMDLECWWVGVDWCVDKLPLRYPQEGSKLKIGVIYLYGFATSCMDSPPQTCLSLLVAQCESGPNKRH